VTEPDPFFEVAMESAMLQILAKHGQNELEKVGMGMGGGEGSNPIVQAIAMHTMQQPPPNLPMLASLYTQKLEKDLRGELEQPSEMDEMAADPLHQENKRLRRMTENMRLKMSMIRMQREMARIQGEVTAMQGMAGMAANPAVAAAAGGLPAEAGGVPPEAAAAAAQGAQAPAPQGPPVGGAPASAPQAPPGAGSAGVGPVEAASM
jgi:hypothetical protein